MLLYSTGGYDFVKYNVFVPQIGKLLMQTLYTLAKWYCFLLYAVFNISVIINNNFCLINKYVYSATIGLFCCSWNGKISTLKTNEREQSLL